MIPHGTLLMVLKPGSILGAAEADVKRYKWNKSWRSIPHQHYAFDRRHVRKAMRKDNATGVDIILAALSRPRSWPGQRQADDQGTLPRRRAAAGGDRRGR